MNNTTTLVFKTPTKANLNFDAIEVDFAENTYKIVSNFFCADVVLYNKKALDDLKRGLTAIGYKEIA